MGDKPNHPFRGNQFTTVYHGTVSGKAGSIRQRGLQTKKAGTFYPGLSNTDSVYVSTDPESAAEYAIEAAVRYNMEGAYGTQDVKPIVLKVRIPDKAKAKLEPDEKDEMSKPGTGFKFKADIPPSWIKERATVLNNPYTFTRAGQIPELGTFERLPPKRIR
jgi:hypothetical protein